MSSSPPPSSLFDRLCFTLVPTLPIGDDNAKTSRIPWPSLCFDSKEELLKTIRVDAPFLLDGCCPQQTDREEYIEGIEIFLTMEELKANLNPPYNVKLLLGSKTPNGLKAMSMHHSDGGGSGDGEEKEEEKGEEQRYEFMPNVSKFRAEYSPHPGFDNGMEEALPIMADKADRWRTKFMANKHGNKQSGSTASASSSSSSSAGEKKKEEGKKERSSVDSEQKRLPKIKPALGLDPSVQPKRKRGRPPKKSNHVPETTDTASIQEEVKDPNSVKPPPPHPLPSAAASVKPPYVIDHGWCSEATRPNTVTTTHENSDMMKQGEGKNEQRAVDLGKSSNEKITTIQDQHQRVGPSSMQPPPPPPPSSVPKKGTNDEGQRPEKSIIDNEDSAMPQSTPAAASATTTAAEGDNGVSVKTTAVVNPSLMGMDEKEKVNCEQQSVKSATTYSAGCTFTASVMSEAGAEATTTTVKPAAAVESPRPPKVGAPPNQETNPPKTKRTASQDDKMREEQNSKCNNDNKANSPPSKKESQEDVANNSPASLHTWVCCGLCGKWRILVGGEDIEALKDVDWVCKMNTADPRNASCDDPERDVAWYNKHYFSGKSQPPTRRRKRIASSKRESDDDSTPTSKKARTSRNRKTRSTAANNDEARTSVSAVTTIQTSPLRRPRVSSSPGRIGTSEAKSLNGSQLDEKLKGLDDGTGIGKSILRVLLVFAQENVKQTTILSLKKYCQEYIEKGEEGEGHMHDNTFIQTLKALHDHGFVSVESAETLDKKPSVSDIVNLPVGLGASLEAAEKVLMHEKLDEDNSAYFKSLRAYARQHRL